ncbi:MAG: rod shape-determining protein [Bryobacterales bacterium]|nr:rod shape-determining protein [Bryobacterales bacterium]
MIGFPSTRLGLDPGTANTLLYVHGRGVAVNEPSLVRIRTASGHIEAVGGEAEASRGRTPGKVQTARPIRSGVISDLPLFDGMLHRFLRKARLRQPWQRIKAAIAVPGGLTEVERLAIVESIRNARATEVLLVDQVLAAARGAGLPIEESRGRMIVNIGAGVTDAAVLSLGDVICARTSKVAGDEMDAAVAAYVRAAHQLIIGERTAERLKCEIGSAVVGHPELQLPVKGRCLVHGIPREVVIRDGEIREAISPALERIVHAIRETLEQTPPELSADLIETGIVLTGGSALLRNLNRYISADCGLPVKVAANPLSSVILGLAYQLSHLRAREWRRFAHRH